MAKARKLWVMRRGDNDGISHPTSTLVVLTDSKMQGWAGVAEASLKLQASVPIARNQMLGRCRTTHRTGGKDRYWGGRKRTRKGTRLWQQTFHWHSSIIFIAQREPYFWRAGFGEGTVGGRGGNLLVAMRVCEKTPSTDIPPLYFLHDKGDAGWRRGNHCKSCVVEEREKFEFGRVRYFTPLSPLHLASRLGLLGMARILLKHGAKHGADVNVKNFEGKSPLRLASGRKRKATSLATRRLLSEYSAI
ncbi:hypothetical protein EDB83DRAFT_2321921 [Lactarius deliciosus]|nr:hypothetical protein EDB83DRAFT_2321921 [Lactarius deliciosus]